MIYTLLSYIWIVASIPFAFFSVSRLSGELHMLQQNNYRNNRYWAWVKPKFRNHTKELIALAAPVPLILLGGTVAEMVALVLWVLAFILMTKNRDKVPAKKPLVFTERATRLYILMLLVYFIPAVVLLFLGVANRGLPDFGRGLFLVLVAVLPLVTPFVAIVANLIIQPYERKQNRRYFAEARTVLAEYPELIKIAVAGSYGKTSVKHILDRMLTEKYYTLMPPGSCNTPMGISKVIREELKPLHQVFLTEMGAKQEGDIHELCDLISPRYGILTAVGEAHLESFGSEEAVLNTKFELIDSLPENGVAVMNFDDEKICMNSDRMHGVVISYGITGKNLDFWAKDIVYREQGTEFTLCAKDGSTVSLRTRLLGIQNVYNIVGAAAMAVQLGVSFKQIKRAVMALAPVEHRLELKLAEGGIRIIDDSFSANPLGAKAALEVLAAFPGGKKFLITPGIVELGEKEAEANKILGKQAAAVCDYIALVGEAQTAAVKEGILEAGFPAENLFTAEYLDETTPWLTELAHSGDCVLYENDLPDLYFRQ